MASKLSHHCLNLRFIRTTKGEQSRYPLKITAIESGAQYSFPCAAHEAIRRELSPGPEKGMASSNLAN